MQRTIIAVALAAATLAGCSKEQSGPVSEAEVREQLAQVRSLDPGEYSNRFEIARFDVPGMPEQQAQMVRQMMTSSAAVQNSYCLTEEQARRGPEDMFRELSRSNGECRFDQFDVRGSDITARLSCRGGQGGTATMEMTGTMTRNSSSVRMITNITDASLPQGRATMEMRVTSQRTGDCTPQSRAQAEAASRAAQSGGAGAAD